jgi:hypothetical protein
MTSAQRHSEFIAAPAAVRTRLGEPQMVRASEGRRPQIRHGCAEDAIGEKLSALRTKKCFVARGACANKRHSPSLNAQASAIRRWRATSCAVLVDGI